MILYPTAGMSSFESPVHLLNMRHARWARVIAFLAIVWSIALAFVALENGTPALLDWAIRKGWVPEELAILRPSPKAASECPEAAVASTKPEPSSEDERRQARFLAWKLGFNFGFAVGLGNAGMVDEAQRAKLLSEAANIGTALHVPAPSAPPLPGGAEALTNFARLVEGDSSCTATMLAQRYDPTYGHAYKVGAVIGHAVIYRIACPQCGAQFVPQIRLHGKEAGLPDEVWQPLMEQPPNSPSIEERQKDAMALVARIDQFFTNKE